MVNGSFIMEGGVMLKENQKMPLIIGIDQIKASVVADNDPFSRNP
jgi:hypothetical protein